MNLQEAEELTVCWTSAQPTVAAFIGAMVPDFHQAEDVLHQVAVTLVRKFEQYDRSQPFLNWAMGMARFEVLKHRRQYATDKVIFDENLIETIGEEFAELADALDERRRALADCLDSAAGRNREVLRLRYFEDLQPAAIAERMNMEGGAVRALLHRARQALRACIERRISLAGEDR